MQWFDWNVYLVEMAPERKWKSKHILIKNYEKEFALYLDASSRFWVSIIIHKMNNDLMIPDSGQYTLSHVHPIKRKGEKEQNNNNNKQRERWPVEKSTWNAISTNIHPFDCWQFLANAFDNKSLLLVQLFIGGYCHSNLSFLNFIVRSIKKKKKKKL